MRSFDDNNFAVSHVLESILGNVAFADEADGVGAFYSAANNVC